MFDIFSTMFDIMNKNDGCSFTLGDELNHPEVERFPSKNEMMILENFRRTPYEKYVCYQ